MIHLCAKLLYPGYSIYGPQPIDSAKNIPKNIPVLLMHSKCDKLCPFGNDGSHTGSWEMYKAMKASGHTSCSFYEIPEFYLTGYDKNDNEVKINIRAHRSALYIPDVYKQIQAFYKENDLPYDKVTL